MRPAVSHEDCHIASFYNINTMFALFCYWRLMMFLQGHKNQCNKTEKF